MTSTRAAIVATAAIAATLVAPAAAPAATLVPPGNSAATQYTEAFPTAGGQQASRGSGAKKRTPQNVLGKSTAQSLEDEYGEAGREAAEVAAATAPPQGGAAGEGGGAARRGGGDHGAGGAEEGVPPTSSAGASGLGETIGSATGASSSTGLGPLHALLILAALIWAIAYAVRRRGRAAA